MSTQAEFPLTKGLNIWIKESPKEPWLRGRIVDLLPLEKAKEVFVMLHNKKVVKKIPEECQNMQDSSTTHYEVYIKVVLY